MAEKRFNLSIDLPWRVESQADIDEAVQAFEGALNRYLADHSAVDGSLHAYVTQPNAQRSIIQRADVNLLLDRDLQELSGLFPLVQWKDRVAKRLLLNAFQRMSAALREKFQNLLMFGDENRSE